MARVRQNIFEKWGSETIIYMGRVHTFVTLIYMAKYAHYLSNRKFLFSCTFCTDLRFVYTIPHWDSERFTRYGQIGHEKRCIFVQKSAPQ